MPIQTFENLVWIDLETTGLDIETDKIIQVACLVTDTELNILDEKGFTAYVKIEDKDIESMIHVVKEMHLESGVIEECKKSELSLEQIDQMVTTYISKFVNPKGSPLCGSSISWDRMFIQSSMPLLRGFLHFRNIDVESIRQVLTMWGVQSPKAGKAPHEALADIKRSIELLRVYKPVLKAIKL
jgi:oligoribonuclease